MADSLRDGGSKIRQVGVAGAVLTGLLFCFLPSSMMEISHEASLRQELLYYLCNLSSIGAFLVASRSPFLGACWLLIVGVICGSWTIFQFTLPPSQPLTLRMFAGPLFWPDELFLVGAAIFTAIGCQIRSKPPSDLQKEA